MHEMIGNGGGWIWLVALLGIVCVGAVIVYALAMRRNHRVHPTVRRVSDEVTREHYKSPEGQKP